MKITKGTTVWQKDNPNSPKMSAQAPQPKGQAWLCTWTDEVGMPQHDIFHITKLTTVKPSSGGGQGLPHLS
jgi:hypothetical protein